MTSSTETNAFCESCLKHDLQTTSLARDGITLRMFLDCPHCGIAEYVADHEPPHRLRLSHAFTITTEGIQTPLRPNDRRWSRRRPRYIEGVDKDMYYVPATFCLVRYVGKENEKNPE